MTTDSIRKIRKDSLGWMIQRIAGSLNREMNDRLASVDLTLPQFAVLMVALENDGLPQTEIAAIVHSPAYAVSRALDRLESQGRIERRPFEGSRRTVAVHTTATGRALEPALHRIVSEVNANLVAPLASKQDRETLKSLLQDILPAADK